MTVPESESGGRTGEREERRGERVRVEGRREGGEEEGRGTAGIVHIGFELFEALPWYAY